MLHGSAAFEAAVAGSHTGAVKAEAWLAGRRIATLPMLSCSVSGDESNFVRRTASMSFADEVTDAGEAAGVTLARAGCEVRVWWGAVVDGRTEWLPIFWGLSEQPTTTWPEGRVTVSAKDLAERVARYRFPKPRSSSPGMTVAQQIETLVREAIPRVRFVDESEGFGSVAVPRVVWEADRNDAVTQLAASVGCETFFRPDGAWVLRRVSSLLGAPALRVRHGMSLVDAATSTDWSSVRNHWVVRSERADGLTLRAEARDLVDTSPTYVFGPLGTITGFYSSTLFTTASQCQRTADALLAKSRGARVTVDWTGLAHPGVEAGDRIDVSTPDATHRLILDAFELDPFAATMTGRGRTALTVAEMEGTS